MSVWDQRPEYEAVLAEWELVRDQLAGTPAMRGVSPAQIGQQSYINQAERSYGSSPWLLRLPTDNDDSYRMRWERAFYFGAYPDAVKRIAAKPFQEPVVVRGYPEGHVIEDLKQNIDRRGTTLHRFACGHFETKIAYGVSHVMLAKPGRDRIPAEYFLPDGSVSELGLRRFSLRPYLRRVHPMRVVAWEFEEGPDGAPDLMEVRIRDDQWEQVGGEYVWVERIHVYYMDAGQARRVTYRRLADNREETQSVEEEIDLGLPFIPLYSDSARETENPDEAMVCRPPMADLLYLNLQHFQESAEQSVALLMARSEGIVEIGAREEDIKRPLAFGLGRAKRTSSTPDEYDLKFVGPSGVGVEHGRESLREIESRMAKLGAQPLIRQSGNVTARGTMADEAKVEAEAEKMARSTEDFFERVFRDIDAIEYGAEGSDERLDGFEIDIFADFGFNFADTSDRAKLVLELNKAGIYPDRLVIETWRALKLLPEETDAEEVMAILDQERAASLERAAGMMENMRTQPDDEDMDDSPDDDAELDT